MDGNNLREELLAILAAHRELDSSADEELVASPLGHQVPQRARRPDLGAAYDALIPIKPAAVTTIALGQGAVLLVLGQYVLRRQLDFYYSSPADWFGHVQAWPAFALLWLVEVIVTVAVLSILAARVEDKPARPRRISPTTRRADTFH